MVAKKLAVGPKVKDKVKIESFRRIPELIGTHEHGAILALLEEGKSVKMSVDLVKKHMPKAGGFILFLEDGTIDYED